MCDMWSSVECKVWQNTKQSEIPFSTQQGLLSFRGLCREEIIVITVLLVTVRGGAIGSIWHMTRFNSCEVEKRVGGGERLLMMFNSLLHHTIALRHPIVTNVFARRCTEGHDPKRAWSVN